MKILYVARSFQHPTLRGSARTYHFIRELSRRHSVTFLSIAEGEIGADAMEEMRSYSDQLMVFNGQRSSNHARGAISGRLPLVGGRLKAALQHWEAVRRMREAFIRLAQQGSYDVVLFHGKDVFPVIRDFDGLPIVVDFCDATSVRILSSMRYAGVARKLLAGLRYLQISQIEKELLKKSPHVAFVSCRDRDAILESGGCSKVIRNGVDVDYWRRGPGSRLRDTLVFTGVMDYAPNQDAAFFLIDRILPLVRRSVPKVKALIVGRNPSPALRERSQTCEGVTVTGFVEDIRPYLEQASVFAAPLRYGSGTQNKILEALAMEIPVVTTSVVAAGLRVDGEGDPPVKVANDENLFAKLIVELLSEGEAEWTRLAGIGRHFVVRHFNWAASATMLEQLCFEAVARARGPEQARGGRR